MVMKGGSKKRHSGPFFAVVATLSICHRSLCSLTPPLSRPTLADAPGYTFPLLNCFVSSAEMNIGRDTVEETSAKQTQEHSTDFWYAVRDRSVTATLTYL
jgi:hypothetical protein